MVMAFCNPTAIFFEGWGFRIFLILFTFFYGHENANLKTNQMVLFERNRYLRNHFRITQKKTLGALSVSTFSLIMSKK